jgi:hypothetical protein
MKKLLFISRPISNLPSAARVKRSVRSLIVQNGSFMKYVPLTVFILGFLASELHASTEEVRERRRGFERCAGGLTTAAAPAANAPTAVPTVQQAAQPACPPNPNEHELQLLQGFNDLNRTMDQETVRIRDRYGFSNPVTGEDLAKTGVIAEIEVWYNERLRLQKALYERVCRAARSAAGTPAPTGSAATSISTVCLDPDDMAELDDQNLSFICKRRRQAQISASLADSARASALWSSIGEAHHDEWGRVSARPRSCDPLIAADRNLIAQVSGRYTNCSWAEGERARKILSYPAAGCRNSSRRQLCSSRVTCDLMPGGPRFSRLSVCSAQHCGSSPGAATACTNEGGFSSHNPATISAPPVPGGAAGSEGRAQGARRQ